MKNIRKICIAIIIILYLLGTIPTFMGFFNRPVLLFGIPCFVLGIVTLALAMLLLTFFLYKMEDSSEED